MKKIILILVILFLTPVFASEKLHVKALEDFSSDNPKSNFEVELIEDGDIDGVFLTSGDKLNLKVFKITKPKRGKLNAKVYFRITSYTNNDEVHDLYPDVVVKYAKWVVNKEEIKKAPKRKIVTKAIGVGGNCFVKGFSYGVSFVDGMVQNKQDNRFKSGVKEVYDDSFLSLVEHGENVEIKTDDEFYFILKLD